MRFEEGQFTSEAKLHLISEPALLDEFVRGLGALREGSGAQAELEATSWYG